MSRRILLIGLLAVLPALGEKCGVETTAPLSNTTAVSRADAPAPPPVDLFVHVVAGSESRLDGYLTETEVNAQVKIIKDVYESDRVGIKLNHNSQNMTKWYVNASWAGDSTNFDEMKTALHRGDYKTLNLYIRNITRENYGGTCTIPDLAKKETPDKARRLALDGCVVAAFTIDGSDHPFMNQGKTAVHEIGHWFGLYHPFDHHNQMSGVNPPDACRADNPDDYLADTPKMRQVGTGVCNETQNSCAEPAGQPPVFDPVHNWMTYSSDACLDRFSDGQIARMYTTFDEYRKTGQPI